MITKEIPNKRFLRLTKEDEIDLCLLRRIAIDKNGFPAMKDGRVLLEQKHVFVIRKPEGIQIWTPQEIESKGEAIAMIPNARERRQRTRVLFSSLSEVCARRDNRIVIRVPF